MENETFGKKTLTYNGTAQTLVSEGTSLDGTPMYSLEKEGTYSTELPKATNAGEYTVYYYIKGSEKYLDSEVESVKVTIQKASYDMRQVKWKGSSSYTYDGYEKEVTLEGTLPEGVTISGYTGNKATAEGTYSAKANFAYDTVNYNAPAVSAFQWRIVNTWRPTQYTATELNENGYTNANFCVTAADGYLISRGNTRNDVWTSELMDSDETDNGSITFYLQDKETGYISRAKTCTYKLDKTNSEGSVSFDERNSWQTFLNTISFDLFYKEAVTVKAEVSDNLSGVERIEYLSSDAALELESLKESADWADMPEDGVSVPAQDEKHFVYYVRITDKAENVAYLSTDGAVFDTQAPEITGIEDGAVYYTTQKVTATDTNKIAMVITTSDDTSQTDPVYAEGPLTEELAGNAEILYVITVTDQAGNETVYQVTMKPISAISETIAALTEENVTGDDAEMIQAVEDTLADVDITNATDEEKDLLTAAQENVDALQKVIADTADEVAALEERLSAYDLDSIKLTDEEDVTKLLNDLTEKLEDPNLSESQKETLTKALAETQALAQQITDDKNALEDVLQKAEDAKSAAGLNADVPGNADAVEKAVAAKQAYDALSDRQKSQLDAAQVQQIIDLYDKAVNFVIIKGADGVYTRGSSAGLSFTANGAFELFTEVRVDGKTVSSANYTAKSGSTVVTLKADYLETLKTGSHTFEVVYEVLGEEHIADCEFAVEEAAANETGTAVNTGDTANIAGWMSAMLVSALAFTGVLLADRKRRKLHR